MNIEYEEFSSIEDMLLFLASAAPPMKVFMYGILKAGTWAIMRYLRGLCKDLFNGRMPEDIIEKYARSRSVAAPNFTK